MSRSNSVLSLHTAYSTIINSIILLSLLSVKVTNGAKNTNKHSRESKHQALPGRKPSPPPDSEQNDDYEDESSEENAYEDNSWCDVSEKSDSSASWKPYKTKTSCRSQENVHDSEESDENEPFDDDYNDSDYDSFEDSDEDKIEYYTQERLPGKRKIKTPRDVISGNSCKTNVKRNKKQSSVMEQPDFRQEPNKAPTKAAMKKHKRQTSIQECKPYMVQFAEEEQRNEDNGYEDNEGKENETDTESDEEKKE